MGNGDVWTVLNKLREDIHTIAESGCAHRDSHHILREELKDERRERTVMGKELLDRMETIRNQIIFGVAFVMLLAVVADRILK